jgi:MinD-like ATPase involved in chromosome partitioning or flagellar assembly
MDEVFDRAKRVDEFDERGSQDGSPRPHTARGSFVIEDELTDTQDRPQPPKRGLVGNARRQAEYREEVRRWEDSQRAARIRGCTWGRPMSALVLNPKGSSGKTPTVIGLGGALAQIRSGGVAAFEAADSPGTLGMRAEGSSTKGLKELLDAGELSTRAAVERFGLLQSSGLWVFPTVGRRAPWTATDVDTIRETVSEHFSITVADSANNDMSPAFGACLKAADALVITTSYSTSSARAVASSLRWLEEPDPHVPFRPELYDRTIVVVSDDGRRPDPVLKARFASAMRDKGHVRVVEIPFDDHIAEDKALTFSKMSPETQAAYRLLAFEVAEAFTRAVETED